MWVPEVDRDVRGAHPREEVLVRNVGVHRHARAEPAPPHHRLDVVPGDATTDQREVHVLRQAHHRLEDDVDQLGGVLIAEHADQRPHPHRLERPSDHTSGAFRLPDARLALDDRVRGHEDRCLAAERAQVALDEG